MQLNSRLMNWSEIPIDIDFDDVFALVTKKDRELFTGIILAINYLLFKF